MGIVIVILLMTFIAIKKYSPTLLEDNQIEEEDHYKCATRWFGEIFCILLFCSFILGVTLVEPPPVWLPFLFNLILKVGYPAFYIYSFPSLSVYVNTCFKKNVLNPIIETKEIVTHFLSKFSFRSSPQIDVNV